MELPFTPTFFNKLDIFQRLRAQEKIGDPLWKYEKELLRWASSPKHRHKGSSVSTRQAKEVVDIGIKEGRLRDTQRMEGTDESAHTIRALVANGFADTFRDFAQEDRAETTINNDGIIAGVILTETNDLKKIWSYRFIILLWWVLFTAGFILVISQSFGAVRNVLNPFPNPDKPSQNHLERHLN